MSTEDFDAFLKALDVVKNNYKCGYCSELCKDPVRLGECFHLICSDHFAILDNCPVCLTSLEGCSTFSNDTLKKCIDSAKELDKIFKEFRTEDATKSANAESVVKKVANTRSKTVEKKEKAEAKIQEKAATFASKKVNKNIQDRTYKATKQDMNSPTMSSLSIPKGKEIFEKRNVKGETMLHIACRLGKVDKVIELLNQGANTNTKDNAGWTPLHEVVLNGQLDLVTLLLQYNTLINVPGQSNETPLHEAIRYNHKDIAVELVCHGADMNATNSKGQTPMQLAAKEMKRVLQSVSKDIIGTQTVNINHMSELYSKLDFEDIKVYCASEQKSVLNKLKLLMKHHSNFHVELKLSKKVTHLIVDADKNRICTSSVDVLQGIVSSIWILTTNWVLNSTDEKLEPFEQYEVTAVGCKTYNGPKNSRYNKYKLLPGIFNGCHIYLHNFDSNYEITKSIVVTKAILTKFIIDAGGIVLHRVPKPKTIPETEKLIPYHAPKHGQLSKCSHYIIFKDMDYEPMYNTQHLKAMPVFWLIKCIEKYELCKL